MNIIIMKIVYWFIASLHLAMAYTSRYTVKTPFTNKKDVVNLLVKPEFYHSYLNHVNAEKIISQPDINSHGVLFPQKISYKSRPNVKCIPPFFPKIHIEQEWNRIEGIFYGNVRTKYVDSYIMLTPMAPRSMYSNCELVLEGEMVNKKYDFIPDVFLDHILKDFGDFYAKFSKMA